MTKQNAANQVCMNLVKKWNEKDKRYDDVPCATKLWTPLVKQDCDNWIKLGSEGWIYKDHVDSLFEKLSDQEHLSRKDTSFLMKLAEVKTELDANDGESTGVRAPRKYPLAHYIRDHYDGYIDYALLDELHQYKGDTEQGQAAGDIANVADKIIGLTGTLLNGYAHGLFYILYRTIPATMKKEGFDYKDESSFLRTFGVVRRQNRFTMLNGRQGDRIGNGSEKALPGVSPLVFTKFLLENAVFVSLSDMSEGLPSYEEIPISVPMDGELSQAYQDLERNLRSCLGGRGGAGVKAMGAFLQSLSVYPDMPYDQPPIIHPDTGETLVVPPVLPRGTRNKEERLLQLVQEKIALGEKVLVYYEWTNRTDIAEKLTNVFRENDINSAVLESKVGPDKREEWINNKVEEGVDVVICNPTLVETGLDLLPFTTIVFYQVGYNIFTMRQASRRSWRLSQIHPIQVYFMYYQDTIQEQALSLMATKLQASMAIEGKFSEEGLRAMSNNEDLLTQIAQSVVQGIEHTIDAEVFKSTTTITESGERVARVRRPRKVKPIILAYLMRPSKQQVERTTTQNLMLALFKKKQHVANLM
jgi:hypothetical protein